MAPPKKGTKMSLGDFLKDDSFGSVSGGSWADDDMPSTFSTPLPATGGSGRSGDGWTRIDAGSNDYGRGGDRRGGDREPVPVPDAPPFTARLLNLDYEVSEDNVKELFSDSEKFTVNSIRLPRDSATGRLRGYGFVEFETKEQLIEALKLDGQSLLNRSLRVVVSERREDDKFGGDWRTGMSSGGGNEGGEFGGRRRNSQSRDDNRDYGNWERRGPLPPLEGDRRRSQPRDDDRDYGNWDKRVSVEDIHPRYRRQQSDRPPRGEEDDGRDYGNWERKGPLPPLEGERRRSQPRDDDRDYSNWERRGPLPPPQRRERRERKESEGGDREEQPNTEADANDDWRGNRPAVPSNTSNQQRRKKLDLKPRTVGKDDSNNSGDRSSIFGTARPVDTTAKLEKAGEKYVQKEHERYEAEKKHRDEIKARDEEKKRKDEAKAEQLRKRFEILKTEGDDDDEEEEEEQTTSSSEQQAEQTEEQPKKDSKTAAETILSAEASKEELESGDWNVVPNKGRGRK